MKEIDRTIVRSPGITRVATNKNPGRLSELGVVNAGVEHITFRGKVYPTLSVGDVLKDRFVIKERIGEGGMGVVFKAIDLRRKEVRDRDENVAIKVLNPRLSQDPVLVMGLQRESKRAQNLSHPNIITVYDFDRDGDFWFLSMEYLDGQPLNDIIENMCGLGGMSVKRAWPIIRGMGKALAYAHSHGIVHSDFKPANVFITSSNEVKVLDFGIASKIERVDQNDRDKTVFRPRQYSACTPEYACSELIAGGPADPRDDIYAFGCVVYELLTGSHPYQRLSGKQINDLSLAGNRIHAPPVTGLTKKQWGLLRSALCLERAGRASDLYQWLNEFDTKTQESRMAPGTVAVITMILLTTGVWWMFTQHDTGSDIPFRESQTRKTGPPKKVEIVSIAESPVSENTRDANRNEKAKFLVPDSGFPVQSATSSDGLIHLQVEKPVYRIGDKLSVIFRLKNRGYVRINHLSASGEISELFPNPFQHDKRLDYDIDYVIPPPKAGFEIQISGPPGIDEIVAVFSESDIPKKMQIIDPKSVVAHREIPDGVSTVVLQYYVEPK